MHSHRTQLPNSSPAGPQSLLVFRGVFSTHLSTKYSTLCIQGLNWLLTEGKPQKTHRYCSPPGNSV
uniref:Uncharacterized protein n=1 Tax=Anguilla anguilla TaxID=7936 RepID=A0A0E9UCQ6_ANGAN